MVGADAKSAFAGQLQAGESERSSKAFSMPVFTLSRLFHRGSACVALFPRPRERGCPVITDKKPVQHVCKTAAAHVTSFAANALIASKSTRVFRSPRQYHESRTRGPASWQSHGDSTNLPMSLAAGDQPHDPNHARISSWRLSARSRKSSRPPSKATVRNSSGRAKPPPLLPPAIVSSCAKTWP